MGVQVNQAGKHIEGSPIQPFRALWCLAAGRNGRYPVAADADALIGEDSASLDVNKPARGNVEVRGKNCGWRQS